MPGGGIFSQTVQLIGPRGQQKIHNGYIGYKGG